VRAKTKNSLLTFLENNLPNVRGFKGCLDVDVFFDESEQEMLLEERWLSKKYHLNYIEFIKNNGILNDLNNFLEKPPQIKYFMESDL
jgi:quinol monooxygenase YgiN